MKEDVCERQREKIGRGAGKPVHEKEMMDQQDHSVVPGICVAGEGRHVP